MNHIPQVKTLYQILPSGTVGGKEFARIVDLLLYQEARREDRNITLFSDVAGDYNGLDSFEDGTSRSKKMIGYQYKFFPSPLSANHRSEIIKALDNAFSAKNIKLNKWIIITPEDLTESSTRKDGGDVTWFKKLKDSHKGIDIEHWGHTKLQSLFLQSPTLCVYYYPQLLPDGYTLRKTIQEIKKKYDDAMITLYGNIEFVGMSVYKPEATRGVPMEHIYIPLTAVYEQANERDNATSRINPISFIEPGKKSVILGDPGSGKSTLQKFLALSGIYKPLQKRYQAKAHKRLSIIVTLRRYADELRTRQNLSIITYVQEFIHGELSLSDADTNFLEYYLETGQVIFLFDGLDELPSIHFKQTVRDRIRTLISNYPGNTIIVTSRIVGYDSTFRLQNNEMGHYKLTNLRLPEIEQFVNDWYKFRIENEAERNSNVKDLIRILRNKESRAIRDLAENPLLLTIVALVHRVDAVLPDERVVLYQKCTETLLNTWHIWKFREAEGKNRGKIERLHKRRMEAIAYWMHTRSVNSNTVEKTVVSFEDILHFLVEFINNNEKNYDITNDAQNIAEEFIDFIRKRAGLLIEVGDNQYSFVHLTFQEYLSSSYVITNNERFGASGIWDDIKKHCTNAQWHEVIRLLIAELRSEDTKEVIVQEIIALKSSQKNIIKSQLLGGLLLDGIEAAENHKLEIIEQLIYSCLNARHFVQYDALVVILQTWVLKDSNNEESFKEVFTKIWGKNTTDSERFVQYLFGLSIVYQNTQCNELTNFYKSDNRTTKALFNLFFDSDEPANFIDIKDKIETLWLIQDTYALTGPSENFFAAIIESLNQSLEEDVAAKRIFEKQLSLIVSFNGPFSEFNYNIFSILAKNGIDLFPWLSTFQEKKRSHSRIRNFILKADTGFDVLRLAKYRLNGKLPNYSITRRKSKTSNQNFIGYAWDDFIDSYSQYSNFLKLLSEVFDLKPEPQWWKSLQNVLLPSIPSRYKYYLPQHFENIKRSILDGNQSDATNYFAASVVLFDVWFLLHGPNTSYVNENPFREVVELSRSLDSPQIHIAHCIRDIVLGDNRQEKRLLNLITFGSSEYKSIFERSLWAVKSEEAEYMKRKDIEDI